MWHTELHLDGFTQDCTNSRVLAMELLQLYAKPLIYPLLTYWRWHKMANISQITFSYSFWLWPNSWEHFFPSVRLSSFHPEIYHWQTWCPCERSRSKVKVTKVMTPFSLFQTVTPVWIHWWLWNDAQNLKWHRRGALLFFTVTRQISVTWDKQLPILTRIERFLTVTPVWIHPWLLKWCTELNVV